MRRKKLRTILVLCGIFYLAAALLPLLSFCSVHEEREGQVSQKEEKTTKQELSATEESVFRLKDADGTILTVEDAEFIKGGIAAEVPPTYELEALKAQGVALYTYYSRLREQNRKQEGEEADFSCNTEAGLVYIPQEERKSRWGEQYETWEKILTQVEESIQGQTLLEEGELLCATYFAISSGSTDKGEDVWGGDSPCLQAVASPGDVFASGYYSVVEMSEEQVKKAIMETWPQAVLGDEPSKWITEIKRSGSGTVLQGKAGGEEATGTELRNAFGLRSANFTWTVKNGSFTFQVKGWGHNVGMSQTGAQYMAQNGADYRQILAWYYPGSELSGGEQQTV